MIQTTNADTVQIEMPKQGRELDAAIAEHVMGWTRHPEKMHPTDNRTIGGVLYCPPDSPCDAGSINVVPYFSTDISAAWTVAEKALEWSNRFCSRPCDHDTHRRWVAYCRAIHPNLFHLTADKAALSICLAALRAKGSIEESTK